MVATLLLLPVLPLTAWGVVIPIAALVVAAAAGRFTRGVPWLRGRVDVRDLAAVLGLYMFWGYTLPAPVGWVPLLVLSLTVGLFEAIFFRGFVQGRLEDSFGTVPAVAGAAVLYALYHVGYGMGAAEMVFLFGLGVVYAIAYRLVGNILVLWPLLTPLGALLNSLEAGDIVLPWASIAGFADVLAVMAGLVWLAHRHQRRTHLAEPAVP